MDWLQPADAKAPRINIVDAIYAMMASGPVQAVLKARLSFIELDKLELDFAYTQLEDVDELFELYWHPFVLQMYYHFSAIGFCPYRLLPKTVMNTKNGEKETYMVPIALERGSFTVRTTMTKAGEKEFAVMLRKEYIQPEIFIVRARHRTGPSAYVPDIDSDCGSLVESWLQLEARRRSSERAFAQLANPRIYFQQTTALANQAENIERDRYERHRAALTDPYGLEQDPPVEITFSTTDRTAFIPPDYVMCSTQPTINHIVTNMLPFDEAFRDHVEIVLGIPTQHAKAEGSSLQTRSGAAVDEARANKNAVISELISDLIHGCKVVFRHIHDDAKDVMVSIPTRSFIDVPTLFHLYDRGVLDEELTATEAVKLVGIHPDRVGSKRRKMVAAQIANITKSAI
jgi:hypothetical protein